MYAGSRRDARTSSEHCLDTLEHGTKPPNAQIGPCNKLVKSARFLVHLILLDGKWPTLQDRMFCIRPAVWLHGKHVSSCQQIGFGGSDTVCRVAFWLDNTGCRCGCRQLAESLYGHSVSDFTRLSLNLSQNQVLAEFFLVSLCLFQDENNLTKFHTIWFWIVMA